MHDNDNNTDDVDVDGDERPKEHGAENCPK
jgi:hypothetical protein